MNILFSDPNANVNFKHGSIPSRDWGMPPPAEWTRKIGLNKIKLFCGMTNGQGFEAEKCNLLVINTKNGKGRDVSTYSKFKTEAEVLFRAGAIFKVLRKFKCNDYDSEAKEYSKEDHRLIVKYGLFERSNYKYVEGWKEICQSLTIIMLDEIVAPIVMKKVEEVDEGQHDGGMHNGLLRS